MFARSKSLCAALALTFAAGTVAPVAAAPVFVPSAPAASSDIIQVQGMRQQQNRFDRRQDRRVERFDRRQDRRAARFERRNGVAYYGGHRGYRQARPGYRQHNGYWFPAAAFIAGAIVGGAVSGGASAGGSAHVQWCQSQYRSYRVSDNTFQPYSGPRRACSSPYG
jgi:hypothetical protein